MIFIPLLILGIGLYFADKRILSGLIFFFFMSKGFQFIPESFFETGVSISKSQDFALLYVLIIFAIGSVRYNDFFVKNKITIAISVFLIFVVASILYSRFSLSVSWVEIIRTSRYFFFVLGYFVFRRLTKDEFYDIYRIIFILTVVSCTFYVLQSLTGIPFLAGAQKGIFGALNRYYNIPILYYALVGFAFLMNPLKRFWKYYSIVIFCLVAITSQHRGMMIAIFVATFWGIYVLEGGIKGIFKYFLIGGILLLPILDVLIDRFSNNTSTDINSVMDGAFTEYTQEISTDGTFVFRLAVLYERAEYVFDDPKRTLMGVGFMAEGSEQTENQFDFIAGLINDDGGIIQLDTSDIAWVPFLLRLGILGTLLYLGIYFLLGQFFYKHRKDRLMLVSFFYIAVLLVNSVSSVELFYTQMIIPLLMAFAIKENELKLEEQNNSEGL